jgi:hypothetical protein
MNISIGRSPGRLVGAADGREVPAVTTDPITPAWLLAEPPELKPTNDDPPSAGPARSPSIDADQMKKPVGELPLPPAMPDGSVSLMPVGLLLDHPDADCIPTMNSDEYEALKEDIRRNNVREPVTVVDQGEALDGRHRIRAARELGIDEIPCRLIRLPDGVSAREWMLTSAVQRRHLTTGQRAALALELDVYLEARNAAAVRQTATQIHGTTRPGSAATPVVAGLPPPVADKSRDVAARLAGASARTVQDVLKIKKEAPDLYTKVRSGELTPNAAIAQLNRRVGTVATNGDATGADANRKSSSGRVAVSPSQSRASQDPLVPPLAHAVARLRAVIAVTRDCLKADPNALGSASDAPRLLRLLKWVCPDVDELVDLIKARGHGRKGAGGKKPKATKKGRATR